MQDWAGAGKLQTEVGYRETHQRERMNRVVELSVEYGGKRDTLLEVGCCEGLVTTELARHFGHVTGVDFVQSLLDVCPPLENVTYKLMDISNEEPMGQWDVIVLSEVLEHLEDPIAVVNKLAPHCRTLVASCPVNEHLNPTHAWDVNRLDLLDKGIGIADGAGHIWAMDMDGFLSMFGGLEILHAESNDVAGEVVAKGALP